MPKQIALLRGINVGGRNKIKMADLYELLTKNGLKEVSTYIQSGNILFQNHRSNSTNAKSIKALIADQYGYDIRVMVRDAKSLTTIVAKKPFSESQAEFLHVTLLSSKPKASAIKAIPRLDFGDDEFKIVDDVAYIYCPDGYAKTKLNNSFFESKLNIDATTRNWKTLNKLIEMAATT